MKKLQKIDKKHKNLKKPKKETYSMRENDKKQLKIIKCEKSKNKWLNWFDKNSLPSWWPIGIIGHGGGLVRLLHIKYELW